MSQPRISVVIPVRNEAGKIEQCLKAVLSQSLKPHEIIVVDGHSTDKTVEKAIQFPVKILYEDYHNRAGGYQIGVENTEGEYIAFTDADCIPDMDWLANLIKEFDDGIVGVGGGVKNVGKGLWLESISLATDTFLGSADSVQGRYFKSKRQVRSISGSNSMYKKSALKIIGGFNTALSGREDAEINSRLREYGKLLYTPSAVIKHDHKRGLKQYARQMYLYGSQMKKSNVWSLPALPPILLGLLIASLVFTRWLFPAMLGIYFIILISMGLRLAIQERKGRYLVSIPIVYAVEHAAYAAGFWRGILLPIRRRRLKSDREDLKI